MSQVKKCPQCSQIQARGRYCSQCGYDLSTVLYEPLIVTPKASPHGNEYGALRFASAFMIMLGWVIIIVSVAFAIYFLSIYSAMGGGIRTQGQDAPSYDPNQYAYLPPSLFLTASILSGLFGSTAGVFTIAAGQVFMVLLDIRDDVHHTTKK